jgi:error-prone DNA polymerase
VRWDELAEFAEGLIALTGDEEGPLCVSAVNRQLSVVSRPTTLHAGCHDDQGQRPSEVLEKLIRIFGSHNVFVEIQRHHLRGEDRLADQLIALAKLHRLPLLATNGVLYAKPYGREVLDVFTCIRHHTHLDLAGKLLSRRHAGVVSRPPRGHRKHAAPG